MNELLKMVLSLSLSGTMLIIMLFIFKPLFREKMSHRWQYYVWLIIVVRLLIPFTPEISLVGTVFQETELVIERVTETNTFDKVDPIQPIENVGTIPNDISIIGATSLSSPVVVISKNLGLIWLVIALIFIIRKVTIYQGFVKYIKAGREEVSDIELLNTLAQIGEQIGVKRPVELYINSLISSPLLLGFFRPCIVLPTLDIPKRDFEYTILHELTHYKRKDMFYKWLVQITICFHWFNPFVYLMGQKISQDCELSCDEEVIKALDERGRREYGDTLLHAMALVGAYKDTISSVTLNESKELLRERLGAIINFREKSKATKFVMLTLTFILIICSIVAGAYTIKNTPIQPTNKNSSNFTNGTGSNNLTQISSGDLSGISTELSISLDIDNGGVQILPTTSNELQANYDEQYYNVQLTNKHDRWIVTISGKEENMGQAAEVELYIPDIKAKMEVDVLNGDFSYNLPQNCQNEVSITAANGGIQFTSSDHYANSDILLVAQEKAFIQYEEPIYPNYFNKTDTGFYYKNGTGQNKINISLTGYTSVEFQEL